MNGLTQAFKAAGCPGQVTGLGPIRAPIGGAVYGLLLALEGSTYREPPTLTEVPAAEITLIARIPARVSIPAPHPSY
jgi:hypothetical protein